MDFFNKSGQNSSTLHIEPFPRRFNAALPVRSIGYLPKKDSRINHAFGTCNFSIILSGTGTYRLRGTEYPVIAPCVITQWPGEPMNYGPDTVWEELYFIYGGGLSGALRSRGLFNPATPLWYFNPTSTMRNMMERLGRNLGKPEAPGVPDRIDHLCEAIILETHLSRTPAPLAADERLLRTMEADIRKHSTAPDAATRVAKEHGLHPATFRRLWNKYNKLTPAAYLAGLRMAEACRLLVETTESIGQIANRVGYNDELYFYRKFRKTYGITAGEYRKQHRNDASMQ